MEVPPKRKSNARRLNVKSIFAFVILWLCTPAIGLGQTLQPPAPTATPAATARALANNDPSYTALRSIRVGTETIHVRDFTLKRDAGTFVFKSGAFHLLAP